MIVTEDVGTVQREAWADGVLPPVEQVRPGLWSIPVPMPRNPLRYVLIYALALPDGLALIDVGWDSEESWRALVDGIAQTGHHVTDVRYAAITHLHPDHFGLAPRLREVSGAALAMHQRGCRPARPPFTGRTSPTTNDVEHPARPTRGAHRHPRGRPRRPRSVGGRRIHGRRAR